MSSSGGGIVLLLAWAAVGVPIAWGIYETLAKAAAAQVIGQPRKIGIR